MFKNINKKGLLKDDTKVMMRPVKKYRKGGEVEKEAWEKYNYASKELWDKDTRGGQDYDYVKMSNLYDALKEEDRQILRNLKAQQDKKLYQTPIEERGKLKRQFIRERQALAEKLLEEKYFTSMGFPDPENPDSLAKAPYGYNPDYPRSSSSPRSERGSGQESKQESGQGSRSGTSSGGSSESKKQDSGRKENEGTRRDITGTRRDSTSTKSDSTGTRRDSTGTRRDSSYADTAGYEKNDARNRPYTESDYMPTEEEKEERKKKWTLGRALVTGGSGAIGGAIGGVAGYYGARGLGKVMGRVGEELADKYKPRGISDPTKLAETVKNIEDSIIDKEIELEKLEKSNNPDKSKISKLKKEIEKLNKQIEVVKGNISPNAKLEKTGKILGTIGKYKHLPKIGSAISAAATLYGVGRAAYNNFVDDED